MDNEVLKVGLAALAPTLVALGGLFQGIKNGRGVKAQTEKIDATSTKTDALAEQTEQIHQNTNGTLTSLRTELSLAHAEITALKHLVTELVAQQRTLEERVRALSELAATKLTTPPNE